MAAVPVSEVQGVLVCCMQTWEI